MSATLIHLPYSPWSERARWALEARGIEHTRRHYQPVVGEPALRWRLGRWRGAVSVPVLLTDAGPIADSWDIARWADERGDGPRLFPATEIAEIERWDQASQRGLAAGRTLSLRRVAATPAALDELTPPFGRPLGSIGRAVTRAGVRRTIRKYEASNADDHQTTLIAVLDELRAALRGPTLLRELSYADITAAQVLVFVRPPDPQYFRSGPVNRELFGDPDLALRYGDLLAWRDALYERHRAPAKPGVSAVVDT